MKYADKCRHYYAEVEHLCVNTWRGIVRKIEGTLEQRRAKKEKESSADRAARVTASATKWMAFFTLVLAATSVGTVWILINQLHEMHAGGIDTHALAAAAQDASGAATDQADAAQQFSDTAEDINTGINGAVDQLQNAAENTKTTIRNAQQAFRDEQRAWVGVQATAPDGFTETIPWKVDVIFFNSGRTPAHNVKSSGMYITSPVPIAGPPADNIAQLVFHPGHSIAPQAMFHHILGQFVPAEGITTLQEEGAKTLVSQYQAIKDGKLFLYYYGILKYDDNSGHHRETQFCIYLADPATKQPGICDGFNEMN